MPSRKRLPPADGRSFGLALPETCAAAHTGHPDPRVRNKVFASPALEGRSVSLKTTSVNLDALVRADPLT
jgi:hypothetical protein